MLGERLRLGHIERDWVPLARDVGEPAAVGGGGGGRGLLRALGVRRRRHPRRDRRQRAAARRLDHQPAGGEERLSLAVAVVAAQGAGGRLHRADRGCSGRSGGSSRSISTSPRWARASSGSRRRRGTTGRSAPADLGPQRSARLMAVLPDPRRRSPVSGSAYIARRGAAIEKGAATIRARRAGGVLPVSQRAGPAERASPSLRGVQSVGRGSRDCCYLRLNQLTLPGIGSIRVIGSDNRRNSADRQARRAQVLSQGEPGITSDRPSNPILVDQ